MALNSKAKPEMAKMAEFRELGECSGPCNQLALLMVDKLGSEPLWCSQRLAVHEKSIYIHVRQSCMIKTKNNQ
jgi:hypothetical protein